MQAETGTNVPVSKNLVVISSVPFPLPPPPNKAYYIKILGYQQWFIITNGHFFVAHIKTLGALSSFSVSLVSFF